MKFLILVSSVLSVALASWEPVKEKYHGPLHYPKIYKGVPVEPAAVQHAREAHFQAVSEVKLNSYNQGYDDHHDDYDSYKYQDEEHQPKWHGPLHYPVIHKGVPVEPVAVQHARAAHLQTVSGQGHYGNHDNSLIGHPVDTHEVAAAKAKHMAAVQEALTRNSHGTSLHYRKRRGAESYVHVSNFVDHHHGDNGYTIHQKHAPVYGHNEDHHHKIPMIGHDGTPQDTLEVQHAKTAHFAAYQNIAQGYHH